MPGEAAKKQKQTEPGNQQQEERRRDERRQTEQDPQQERRRDDRRQGPGSANTTMRAEEQSEYGQEPSRQKWQGENVQSGTSQTQKGEGRTPGQQIRPGRAPRAGASRTLHAGFRREPRSPIRRRWKRRRREDRQRATRHGPDGTEHENRDDQARGTKAGVPTARPLWTKRETSRPRSEWEAVDGRLGQER